MHRNTPEHITDRRHQAPHHHSASNHRKTGRDDESEQRAKRPRQQRPTNVANHREQNERQNQRHKKEAACDSSRVRLDSSTLNIREFRHTKSEADKSIKTFLTKTDEED